MEKREFISKKIFILVFIFVLTLGFGLAVSLKLEKLLTADELVGGQDFARFSFGQFLANFLISLFIIFLVFALAKKFKRIKKSFFKGLFLLASGLGALISLEVFIGNFAFLLVVFLIIFWLKKPSVFSHNLLMILGLAGAGSLLGLRLTPQIVIGLLMVFSVYDYIAVYKTKHMVKMAKEMVAQEAIIGLILPQRFADFAAGLKKVEPAGGQFFILGGGDLAFPLILSASLVPSGIEKALFVAAFAVFGLLANFFILVRQKQREALPALPLVALFCLVGFFFASVLLK